MNKDRNEQAAEQYANDKWSNICENTQEYDAADMYNESYNSFLAGIEYAERRNAEQHKGVNDAKSPITDPTVQDNEKDDNK